MLLIKHHGSDDSARWTYNRLSAVPISPVWTTASAPEPKIHRIHAYPARFPAFLMQQALDYARQRRVRVARVADIFCGSGTVACEAAARNLEFWGCDINPVATLIARVKASRLDPLRFEAQARAIASRFETTSSTSPLSSTAVERLKPWYNPDQFRDLARLRNAILDETGIDDEVAMAFDCAFSAIVKPLSQWRSRSVKPAKDPSKQPGAVLDAFVRQCQLMVDAWAERTVSCRADSEIVLGDIKSVESPSAPVDLIVTSPPYATSYEYADLHQLSALWLGYADDHRDLRRKVIGTSSRRANLAKAVRELNAVGMQIVFSLFDKDRAFAEAVATYFLDMQQVVRRAHDFLRPRGICVFVIGNTQIGGIRIDNANHLVESLIDAGFGDIRVVKRPVTNKPNTPYRHPDGRLSATPTDMRIYAEEFVVMVQRR